MQLSFLSPLKLIKFVFLLSIIFCGEPTFATEEGIIITVAGNGISDPGWRGGFSGDGGLAIYAQFSEPSGIAIDLNGNLYIADYWNHRIRKVSTAGNISTIAGSGDIGFNSGGFSGDGGSATDAQLKTPYDIAVDSRGNLYIADTENHRIRKIDTAGVISTVAGSGSTGYNY